jgi:hypothetical protein
VFEDKVFKKILVRIKDGEINEQLSILHNEKRNDVCRLPVLLV